MSTEPANRIEAEKGIEKIYNIVGLKKPKIVWCSSPLANGLTRALLISKRAGDSVRDSVGDSVWASVWDSVGDSVRDSVGASVGAYSGSLFPNIKRWKYINHEKGIYPFQPAVDLWKQGFVPSLDGEYWRLHAGDKAEIVYKTTLKE